MSETQIRRLSRRIKELSGAEPGSIGDTAKSVENQNTLGGMDALFLWEGTRAQYDAIAKPDGNTIYVVKDEAGFAPPPFALDEMPVGFSMPWWLDTLPSAKYLFMEGQSLAAFPAAQAVFGNNLPDLRGRVMVHKSGDAEFDTMGKKGGHKKLQQHTHSQGTHSHTVHWTANNIYFATGGLNETPVRGSGGSSATGDWTSSAVAPAIQNAGTGDSENLQPYIVCRWIAKVVA